MYKGRCGKIDNHPFVTFKIRLVYSIVDIKLVLGGYQFFLIPIRSNFHNRITKGLKLKGNLCIGLEYPCFYKTFNWFSQCRFS
jgi:hypothetical protein